MNLKSILKIYQKANELYSVVHPANATISLGDNELEINIPGKPSVIEITYSGICQVSNLLPPAFKVHLTKNKIVILNSFRKTIPETLASYSGSMIITDCEILTFVGKRFKATINNNKLQESIQGQRTKVEDDTMTIYDEPKERVRTPFKRSLKTHSFISLLQRTQKKLSGISKEERLDLAKKVTETIFKKKGFRPPVVTQVVKQPPKVSKQPPKVSKEPLKKTQAKGKY